MNKCCTYHRENTVLHQQSMVQVYHHCFSGGILASMTPKWIFISFSCAMAMNNQSRKKRKNRHVAYASQNSKGWHLAATSGTTLKQKAWKMIGWLPLLRWYKKHQFFFKTYMIFVISPLVWWRLVRNICGSFQVSTVSGAHGWRKQLYYDCFVDIFVCIRECFEHLMWCRIISTSSWIKGLNTVLGRWIVQARDMTYNEVKIVKCYLGGRKIDPSISEILPLSWYHCVQYTKRNLMSLN